MEEAELKTIFQGSLQCVKKCVPYFRVLHFCNYCTELSVMGTKMTTGTNSLQ